MKKLIYFIAVIVSVGFFTACETYPAWDSDLKYSDAYPLAGEWYVNDYDTTGAAISDSVPYILYIYNKSYNPTGDSIWIDNKTGHPSGGAGASYKFRFRIKNKANMTAYTFDCADAGDVTGSNLNPTSKSNLISITNSKVFVKSTGITDATADSISFEVMVTDSIGGLIGKYRTSGHRKTGWEEPNYDDDMDKK